MRISKVLSIIVILVILVTTIACGNKTDKVGVTSSDTLSVNNSSNVSSETLSNPDNGTVDFNVPEKYSYYPVISEKMPVIYIESLNGSLDFATQYRREDKMAGAIDYTQKDEYIEEKYEIRKILIEEFVDEEEIKYENTEIFIISAPPITMPTTRSTERSTHTRDSSGAVCPILTWTVKT